MSTPPWPVELLDVRPQRARVRLPDATGGPPTFGLIALLVCVFALFTWPWLALVIGPIACIWMLVPWSPRVVELTADRLAFRHPFRPWDIALRHVTEVRAEQGVVHIELPARSKQIPVPGPPESAELLATALRDHIRSVAAVGRLPPQLLGVDAAEPPTGLERWTRWTHDGAELDLSPVDGPVGAMVIAASALFGGSIGGTLGLAALPPFGFGPVALVAAMLLGVLFAVLPLFDRPHHVQLHIDRTHLRVTRRSRLRTTTWSLPLGEVKAALPYASGVAIDTTSGRRTLTLRGRSRATRAAVASSVELALARARDPGSASDVPQGLRALVGENR
jgi:hypothetical protein